MKWQGREGSTNIEDRRGMSGGGMAVGGGLGGLVLLLLISALTGTGPAPAPWLMRDAPGKPERSSSTFRGVLQ